MIRMTFRKNEYSYKVRLAFDTNDERTKWLSEFSEGVPTLYSHSNISVALYDIYSESLVLAIEQSVDVFNTSLVL